MEERGRKGKEVKGEEKEAGEERRRLSCILPNIAKSFFTSTFQYPAANKRIDG